MKVHVNVTMEGISVNEIFDGTTADEIVGKMKARVAREMNFAMKMVINSMSNLMFVQEVTRRYNDFKKLNLALPNSCEQFLTLAQEQGMATIS